MNIFQLDMDPVKCAEYHCDKHINKMLVEYAQLLSTAHHLHGDTVDPSLYKPTHVNHPSNIWVRQSKSNYEWLYALFVALAQERAYRYPTRPPHATVSKLSAALAHVPKNLPDIGLTPILQAMPDDCKGVNGVQAYRDLYRTHKTNLHTWTGRPDPPWLYEPEWA